MLLGIADVGQLAPDADRGTADLLKGADPPPTSPSAGMLGTLVGLGACLFITIHMLSVDVLGDIASGIGLGRVYLLPVKAGGNIGVRGPHSLALQLGLVMTQGVVLQSADHPPLVDRTHKKQQVPVRSTIVMGLTDAKAIDRYTQVAKCPHY